MARAKKKEPGSHREITALVSLFIGIFLLLCLVSYARSLFLDPPILQEPDANWCGGVGYFTARYLFSFVGIISFFPALLLLYLAAAAYWSEKGTNRLASIIAGITGILLSASGLLTTWERLIFPAEFIRPGGYLGTLIRSTLEGVLGGVGSVLFLVLILIFSLMAAVRFSPAASIGWCWRTCIGFLTRLWGLVLGIFSLARSKLKWDRAVPPPVAVGGKLLPVKKTPRTKNVTDPAQVPGKPAVYEPVKQEVASDADASEFGLKPVKPGVYQLPPITLLEPHPQEDLDVDRDHYYKVSEILVAKLEDFGVRGTVIGVSPGPVVTTYEFSPAAGIKINKIVNLSDDLAMVLKVDRVRVVGSIPGKAAIGIEIPNPERKTVFLRDILLGSAYRKAESFLTLALGFDVVGRPAVADLSRMPHLLIAGATGAGKSVAINAFIASILFKATPEEVRLLLIDPKRIELSSYEGIPHLLHPVVVEPQMASRALMWAVKEMERRYRLLEQQRVKSFTSYNAVAEEKLPLIVIIVDELADLMMVASKDVETSIARLAQMARAAGMHIVLATQRPSVDVLTGLIKANFPTRISFKVSSKVDSRTILDGSGAEHLLGLGDMLFLPPGAAKLQRIHGAFITEEETERIIVFLKEQGTAQYDESVMHIVEDGESGEDVEEQEYDEKYDQAVAVVTETGQASISMVQRKLRVGYNRAARMIEVMEREGIVGPSDGSRPREVLARSDYS